MRDIPVTAMTSWRAPFTGGYERTLPAGEEFVIANDPPHSATAVYADPVNYRKLHSQFVPAADRIRILLYTGYYLCVDLKRIASDCKLVSDRVELASKSFNPGFRISGIDAAVLVAGSTAAFFIGQVIPWFGAAIAFVIGHFFLFCNLIRMARPSELAWSALFVALATSTIYFGVLTWPAAFGLSLIATIILVALELRKPSYHGIFWRRINPNLPQWWETHTSA